MIQNRITTLTSLHPLSSKWWCSGEFRKTRLPVVLYEIRWMTSDIVMITKRPPMIGSSSTVRVAIAIAATRPPIAIAPVSPMMIFAGEAFHHRNPHQRPRPRGARPRQAREVCGMELSTEPDPRRHVTPELVRPKYLRRHPATCTAALPLRRSWSRVDEAGKPLSRIMQNTRREGQ
jgi:hypothetical protein